MQKIINDTTNNNNTDRDTNSNSSGTVTINAKLIDSSGTPLQGFMMEMHSTVKKNRTNSSGIATFSGTEIGNHVVYILNSSGNSTANFRFSLKKGEKFSRKGNVFTVVPGQTINLTITLNGSTAVISDVSVIGGDVRSADTGDKTIPSKWVFSLLIGIFGVMIVTHLKRKYK